LGWTTAKENELKRVEKKQLLSSGDTIWVGGERMVIRTEAGTHQEAEA